MSLRDIGSPTESVQIDDPVLCPDGFGTAHAIATDRKVAVMLVKPRAGQSVFYHHPNDVEVVDEAELPDYSADNRFEEDHR